MADIYDSRILLVNDHTGVCEWQKKFLSDAGFRNIDIDDGSRAASILAKTGCDLLIQDLQRPKPNGVDLYMWMKRCDEYANIPIILATVSTPLYMENTRFTKLNSLKFELTFEMVFSESAPASMYVEGYLCLWPTLMEMEDLEDQAERILRFWTGIDKEKEYERRNRHLWPAVRNS